MPTKRTRVSRYRAPVGWEGISLLERLTWATSGPVVAGAVDDPRALRTTSYTVWPDWASWARFYGEVRDEYLAWRRGSDPPACERLYAAIQRGDDPMAVRRAIAAEWEANDPRRALNTIERR